MVLIMEQLMIYTVGKTEWYKEWFEKMVIILKSRVQVPPAALAFMSKVLVMNYGSSPPPNGRRRLRYLPPKLYHIKFMSQPVGEVEW